MIIIGSDIDALKQTFSQHFEMKDLGRFNYFLGLEVLFDSTGYNLSQEKYTSDILARAGLTDCETAQLHLK